MPLNSLIFIKSHVFLLHNGLATPRRAEKQGQDRKNENEAENEEKKSQQFKKTLGNISELEYTNAN
jgi:hypothetical protein